VVSPKKKGRWFLVWKSLLYFEYKLNKICWKFPESRQKVTSGIVSTSKSFQPSKFCYSSSMDLKGSEPLLISSQGANWLLMSVAAHPSTTKSPRHYIVSLISWTKTKNRVGRCDHLHLIASSSSKIPGTPTISQVQSSHSKPHYTTLHVYIETSKNWQRSVGCHYNCSWNPRLFHQFPWSSS